jgi:hypothetical protein
MCRGEVTTRALHEWIPLSRYDLPTILKDVLLRLPSVDAALQVREQSRLPLGVVFSNLLRGHLPSGSDAQVVRNGTSQVRVKSSRIWPFGSRK